MAITITTTGKTVFGNKRVRYGNFTKTAAGTSESFATGLKTLDYFDFQITDSGTSTALAPKIDSSSSFPLSSGTVTVHFDTGTTTGIWKAEGK